MLGLLCVLQCIISRCLAGDFVIDICMSLSINKDIKLKLKLKKLLSITCSKSICSGCLDVNPQTYFVCLTCLSRQTVSSFIF